MDTINQLCTRNKNYSLSNSIKKEFLLQNSTDLKVLEENEYIESNLNDSEIYLVIKNNEVGNKYYYLNIGRIFYSLANNPNNKIKSLDYDDLSGFLL